MTEADPHGRDQHEPGSKLDKGKVRVGLLFQDFPRALKAVAEVATHGAQKYTPHGWLDVRDGFDRYTDAMGRHLLEDYIQEQEGSDTLDRDSALEHAAHLAWNALARLELMLRGKG